MGSIVPSAMFDNVRFIGHAQLVFGACCLDLKQVIAPFRSTMEEVEDHERYQSQKPNHEATEHQRQ